MIARAGVTGLSFTLSSGLFNQACLYASKEGGQLEERNVSKTVSEYSLEIFCGPNDARRNYSLDSFSIYSNLNDMISKVCRSYRGRKCGKTKKSIFVQMFREEGETKIEGGGNPKCCTWGKN